MPFCVSKRSHQFFDLIIIIEAINEAINFIKNSAPVSLCLGNTFRVVSLLGSLGLRDRPILPANDAKLTIMVCESVEKIL